MANLFMPFFDASLLLAAGYGLFMGSYPVPIKAPAVLKADVHPIVFQCYKSFWVCVTGCCFLFPILARGDKYEFTWWGVASAACWVPSGACTILAVTLNGVALSIVVACSACAVLNFLVFWLVLGEKMRTHDIGGHEVVLAPLYLCLVVIGMIGLVYGTPAERVLRPCPRKPRARARLPRRRDPR